MVEAGRTKTAWFLAEVIFALLALVALAVGIHAFGGGPVVTVHITAQNPYDVFACEHRPGAVEGDRCSRTAEVVRLWVSEHASQEAP